MAKLELKGVVKRFNEVEVVKAIDLAVADGEFAVLVGPSGCGKSTILRMLAGLEAVSEGLIEIDGRDVTGMVPLERGVAMVFQSYALYPHMTVEDNIGFGLKIAGLSRAARRPKVLEAARTLQLEPYLARKPKQLSGGQRQRVAIGRAIVKHPKIFLFDEPLSNLDAELRVQMRVEIARLHQEIGATMIYVTHDQVEAMTLADRIVVLNDGRVEQVGPPIEIYERPDNLFVAGFIGSPKMNFIDLTANAQWKDDGTPAAAATLGVRPEHVVVSDEGPVSATVKVIEQLGNVSYLHVETDTGAIVVIEERPRSATRIGAKLCFGLDAGFRHYFDHAGRRI